MQIKEVMTANPTCCISSDTAQTAAIIMRDEDTGIVPVVEGKSNRQLVGVVTDRDLCVGVLANAATTDLLNVPVEQCMTTKVISCKADEEVDAVLDAMQENQIRRIVVIDNENKIQGIVSMADLMNRGKVEKGATVETLKSISKPTGESSKPRAESAASAND